MKIIDAAYQLGARSENLASLKRDNPEWDIKKIFDKTGVDDRYLTSTDESVMTLAAAAGKKVLSKHGSAGIDALIFVSQSHDILIPSPASRLQVVLELPTHCQALDLIQGCSGFVYALTLAQDLLGRESIERCLIVCASEYSRFISKHNAACRPLFSDAGSAVLLESDAKHSLLAAEFLTDGAAADYMCLEDNLFYQDIASKSLYMHGASMFLHVMNTVPSVYGRLLQSAGLSLDAVDYVVFHQASRVMLEGLQQRLCLPESKVIKNFHQLGNTVSSSIPIILSELRDQGKLACGTRLLLLGFGVGFSIAGCIWDI